MWKKKQTPPEISKWARFRTNAKMTDLPAPTTYKMIIMINSAGICSRKWLCVSALRVMSPSQSRRRQPRDLDGSNTNKITKLRCFQHWQFIKHQFLCKLPGDNQTKILKSCRKKQKPSRITLLTKNNSFWASRFRESGSEKLEILLF